MQQSRISYNVNGAGIDNPEVLNAHLLKINPRWLLIMDNVQMGWDIADGFKNTNVVLRNWALTQGDENVYSQLSPEAWLDARIGEAKHNVWLYTANEAGINPQWDIQLMKLIISRGLKNVKLVLGNPSVGTPSIDDWKRAEMKEWFKLLDEHRDQFVLGVHEYFSGIATSGFIGGFPDGSWVDGRTNLHPNYEDRRTWPKDATVIGTLWHCGRVLLINAAARSFGYMPPRVVITEHGADDLADMHGWLNKFPSAGRENIRGWKSIKYLWQLLLPGMDIEEAYFYNVSYLDQAVYSRIPNVEGQLLFTWSNHPRWDDFDLSKAEIFRKLLEEYTDIPPVVVIPNPPPVNPPTSVTITVSKVEFEEAIAELQKNIARLIGSKSL